MLIEDLLMVVNSSEKEDAVTNEPRASVFMDEKLFKSRCLTIFVHQNLVVGTFGLIFDVFFCFLNEIWINFGSTLGKLF